MGIYKNLTLLVAGLMLLQTGTASAEPQLEASATAETGGEATADATAPTAEGDAAPAGETAEADAAAETTIAPEPVVTEAELEPEAAPAEATPLAGYEGGFFIQSSDGAFKLKIGGRIKARYNFYAHDMGPDTDRDFDNNFSVPYARLYFSGHLFDKKLTYLINPGFGGGRMKLILAFADYAFVPGKLHLTFGQMKRPFSRNYLTSSGKRAFINGPTGQFGNGIDLGLQLSNNFTKAKGLEWAFGLYNSANAVAQTYSGGTVTTDPDGTMSVSGGGVSNAIVDFNPAMVARIGYNNGIKGYHPTDFEGGSARFGVAMSGHLDFNADEDDNGLAFFNFDYILKVQGFSLNGGVYTGWSGIYGDNPGYDRLGTFIQLQYLIAGKFEPVLRYGIEALQGDDNNEQEITVGFTIYAFGTQNFKWENNFSTFMNQTAGDPLIDLAYISQLQFLF